MTQERKTMKRNPKLPLILKTFISSFKMIRIRILESTVLVAKVISLKVKIHRLRRKRNLLLQQVSKEMMPLKKVKLVVRTFPSPLQVSRQARRICQVTMNLTTMKMKTSSKRTIVRSLGTTPSSPNRVSKTNWPYLES
jgi:hypothetical protein